MSYREKKMIPLFGMLLIFAFAVINVVSTEADDLEMPLPAVLKDLAAVNKVEIKNEAGEVVLSGSFSSPVDKLDEMERVATLSGTGVAANAMGIAEIEVSKESNGFVEQEIEVKVRGLAPQAVYKLFIDDHEIATLRTDAKGDAELEMSNDTSK